ncbi:MAG: sigma 54-interacting transcriptional regulator [candidate division NC10 bacterium]|nr:sigma 54-interacting transcriptional regulator [candidate division NC10 bacterium]
MKKAKWSCPEKGDPFFHLILESIADGVFTTDGEGRITSFNRAAEAITGFSQEEAIGHFCFDIFRASLCQTECGLKKSLRTGKPVTNLRAEILTKEGKEVPISISTSVLRDKKGKLLGAVETFRDLSALEALRKELSKQYSFSDIVSKNHKILDLFQILPDIAESDSTVLIQGPTGSGKELFARAIHNLSRRKGRPYVKVSCAAVPETLLESELFGYVKGAFTDARRDKPGRFALAEKGTIFLDEIGDLPPSLQVKLLRILQEKEYEPLGATVTVKADVRVIAATHRDLSEMVKQGQFREDLYYRLNVVKISLPPLAERREDIPLLVEHFVRQFNLSKGKQIAGVTEEVMELLMNYDYPGNVRELQNIIEHSFVLCRGELIQLNHLPRELLSSRPPSGLGEERPHRRKELEEAEASLIRESLNRHGGSRQKVAQELGCSRATLWRKMKRLGVKG